MISNLNPTFRFVYCELEEIIMKTFIPEINDILLPLKSNLQTHKKKALKIQSRKFKAKAARVVMSNND
jgi:hypothetical protein